MKDSPILLLDEATASLDIENELAVRQAIANLMKQNKTVVMIAHILSIVKNADQILVVSGGTQLARMQHLNIRFTDIRPGFVATDLLRNAKYPMLMQADKVALQIVKALKRKKRVVVIDGRYRLLVFFWRMIPRWLWERLPIKN